VEYFGSDIDWLFERLGKIMTELEILQHIANSVDVIMLFTILNYASACMRSWRKNVIRG